MLRSLLTVVGLSLAAAYGAEPTAKAKQPSSPEYVYTLTNDTANNAVAVFERMPDGRLHEVPGSPFPTGGKGLAGGDIDQQGAIRVHGDYLLAVNPGSDSVSVFRKSRGRLELVPGAPFASGGNGPLSLTAHGGLVFIANQAPAFAQPRKAPNIAGFRLNSDGQLTAVGEPITLPIGRGPAQVEFSPNGKLLAAVGGFQDEAGSRVYSFAVGPNGELTAGANSPLQPQGASGVVGFSWTPQSDRLLVSNFRGSAVAVFGVDPRSAAIQQLGSPVNDKETAACWTAISKDGRTLYVANFVSNSISTFDVQVDGTLRLLGSTKRRSADTPDTKDLVISKDGKHLYALGSGAREISIFAIGADRMPAELPVNHSPVKLNQGQNLLGLAVK